MSVDAVGQEAESLKQPRVKMFGRPTAASVAGHPHVYEDPGAVDSAKVYGRGRYRASQLNVLVSRYVKIRGDLLIEWGNVAHDEATEQGQAAAVCADYLRSAKRELESRRAKLPVVANYLALADRSLVSLYRPRTFQLRLNSVVSDLQQIEPLPTNKIAQIRWALRALDMGKYGDDDLDVVKTALKDGISYVHGQAERNLIEDDLQVSRLNALLVYVVVGWVLLMAAVPFVSTFQLTAAGEVFWPVANLGLGTSIDLIAGAIGLSIVGAVGGIISGMLTVRDSRATLLEYRTSMKKMALKPTVGAVAALTVYLFLSAQVISGVEVTGAGTYIVAGFVAGFSERYLLKLVNAQIDPAPAPNSQPRSSTAIGPTTEERADPSPA